MHVCWVFQVEADGDVWLELAALHPPLSMASEAAKLLLQIVLGDGLLYVVRIQVAKLIAYFGNDEACLIGHSS